MVHKGAEDSTEKRKRIIEMRQKNNASLAAVGSDSAQIRLRM